MSSYTINKTARLRRANEFFVVEGNLLFSNSDKPRYNINIRYGLASRNHDVENELNLVADMAAQAEEENDYSRFSSIIEKIRI